MLSFEDKKRLMLEAIQLAEQGKGYTAPNPCVGAVLADEQGSIVARGWHTACGQAHAEVEAIRDMQAKGLKPQDLSLFVTLEPCNHHGKTPPCTRAILKAGIQKVVVGTRDLNKEAAGGIEFLRSQGVKVEVGVAEQECLDLLADFIIWQKTRRPYIYLKLATTLDGKIATRTGHSAWVSGPESRQAVHELRSKVQAVLIGGNTFRTDNPGLDCRLQGYAGAQPLAVIATTCLPEDIEQFKLLRSRPEQVIFWTNKQQEGSDAAEKLRQAGCQVWGIEQGEQGLQLSRGLQRLRREYNCHYVLCEGGGTLAMHLVEFGLVDELRLFMAMKIVGDNQALSGFSGKVVRSMQEALNFRLQKQEFFGKDLCLHLKPDFWTD